MIVYMKILSNPLEWLQRYLGIVVEPKCLAYKISNYH